MVLREIRRKNVRLQDLYPSREKNFKKPRQQARSFSRIPDEVRSRVQVQSGDNDVLNDKKGPIS